MRFLITIWVSIYLTACGNFSQDQTESYLKTSDGITEGANTCYPPQGWQDVYVESPQSIFLFGEWNGTQGAPGLAVEFACAIAQKTGQRTRVLFEVDSYHSKAFQKALSVPKKTTESILRDTLKEFWQGDPDSREGRRLLNAMLRVKQLHDQGVPIEMASTGVSLQNFMAIYNNEVSIFERYRLEAKNMIQEKTEVANIVAIANNYHTAEHARYFKEVGYKDYSVLDYVYTGSKALICSEQTCGMENLTSSRNGKFFKAAPFQTEASQSDNVSRSNGWYLVKEPNLTGLHSLNTQIRREPATWQARPSRRPLIPLRRSRPVEDFDFQ